MRPTKRQVLETLSFGHRIAEDEADALSRYFVRTETWRQLDAGEVDVVYGAKGTGKSALYALLTRESADRRANGTIVVPCEEVRGATAFEQLKADPPTSEAEFRLLWAAYFLSLLAQVISAEQIETADARVVVRRLSDLGLAEEPFNISAIFRKAAALARRVRVESQVTWDPSGAATVTGKTRLDDPKVKAPSGASLLELFAAADRALADSGRTVWLALDRLDVAFADEPKLETNALRSLFHTYRSLEGFRQIQFKVFLRSDIWTNLTRDQFREASHITRERNLRWSHDNLLNLIVRRAAENIRLLEYYGLDKESLLDSLADQRSFCSARLLEPVETTRSGPVAAFDWMMTVFKDGTLRVSPRDVIHFMTTTREAQLNDVEVGGAMPPGEYVLGRRVYSRAFHEVAVFRLQRSFFAEYPKLRPYVEALEGAAREQDVPSLQRKWGANASTVLEIAQRLAELGVLQKKRTDERVVFHIPPLTRAGLAAPNGT